MNISANPALVKQVSYWPVFFLNFTNGLTALVSLRPGAKVVLRRPRLAGTHQYIVACQAHPA